MVFNVKSNDDITGKVITAFSITGAKSGTLAFSCAGKRWRQGFRVGLIRQRLLPKHLPLPQNPCPYRIKVLRRKLCYVPTSCSPHKYRKHIQHHLYIHRNQRNANRHVDQSAFTLTRQMAVGAFVSYTIGMRQKAVTATTESHPTWGNGGQGSVDGNN